MRNLRLILYGALALVLVMLYQAWNADYGSRPGAGEGPSAESQPASGSSDTPATAAGDTPEAPVSAGSDEPADAGPSQQADSKETPDASASLPKGRRVNVVTDLLEVTLDTYGADMRQALLRQHHAGADSEQPVALLSAVEGQPFAVAQSGLQAGDHAAPTHHDEYQIERTDYRLAEGQDTLTVPFTWSSNGVRVIKEYTFHRDSYIVDVDFRVENTGDQAWVGREYRQLQRAPVPDSKRPTLLPGFFGPAYYSATTKYEELYVEDLGSASLPQEANEAWVALVDHYFLSAWIPEGDGTNSLYSKKLDGRGNRHLIGLYSPGRELAAGEQTVFSTRLFIGPKERDYLAGIAPGLTNTIDYGYMAFLSRPLFWVLDHIHEVVGNWGWAIIILTLMIKLVFYKLSETSYKSMARMKKLQPKIEQLKERYGDDREKMGRAMMDLYKTEKVNPIGGCLPILVQIPVFIALYWMLLGSVELRHADFALWINDLSARDPYFVLPLLMGASMWLQQKLNPAPVDPVQQKIFMALPIVFTVFFAFFPAGLVIYWLTNNVLSIAQQYYITRHVVKDHAPAKQGGG